VCRRGDPPSRPALTVGELDAFGNFVHPPNDYGGNMIGERVLHFVFFTILTVIDL
jgi:hypothetical protein